MPGQRLLGGALSVQTGKSNMGSRIILFPTERSLGKLTLQEPGNNYSRIMLGEAMGQIVAPLDKEITLTIDHSMMDFSALSKLAEDAVDILNFNNTKVTDSDLRHIHHMAQLKGLALWETDLGDGALKHITHFRKLRWLDLGDTRISNNGLAALKGLISLEDLTLLNTEIGDLGIEHLESLPWLKRLDLMSSMVSDACIRRLKRFSSLRYLRIYQTRISENGYLEIAEALPDCHIWFYRSNDLG